MKPEEQARQRDWLEYLQWIRTDPFVRSQYMPKQRAVKVKRWGVYTDWVLYE